MAPKSQRSLIVERSLAFFVASNGANFLLGPLHDVPRRRNFFPPVSGLAGNAHIGLHLFQSDRAIAVSALARDKIRAPGIRFTVLESFFVIDELAASGFLHGLSLFESDFVRRGRALILVAIEHGHDRGHFLGACLHARTGTAMPPAIAVAAMLKKRRLHKDFLGLWSERPMAKSREAHKRAGAAKGCVCLPGVAGSGRNLTKKV